MGYSDYASMSTSLSKGATATITITPIWVNVVSNEGYAVWIDYNKDGDFEDPGEQVWTKAVSQDLVASGAFTVPANATNGATRMRVSMKYNGVPTPCESFSYGEVEDYTVIIDGVAPPPPSGYCSFNGKNTNGEYISRVQLGTIDKASGAGSTSTGYSDFTSTSTNLSKGVAATITVTPTWTGTKYNEGYAVWIDYNDDGDFADPGEQVWTKAPSKTTPASGTFTVPANASIGETRMRVSMKYNGIPTPCESFSYGEVEDYTVVIGAAPPPVDYCSSNGQNTNDEYISRVIIANLDKTSGAGTTSTGYSDFTSTSANLIAGSSTFVNIVPSWTGIVYPEGYSIWIDYNKDGDFTDSGEQVWTKAPSKTTPIVGSFAIPASTPIGETRMRVSMKYNGIPSPCESFSYGEVEDYTVNITGAFSSQTIAFKEVVNLFEVDAHPNPAKETLYVKSSERENSSHISYVVMNMLGQEVARGILTANGIDVSDFESGLYMLRLSGKNGTATKKFIKQ